MLHFLEDRYVEFLRNHRQITVLRLDHRWHVYRATCADVGYEKLECLRAPGGKIRRAWHAPDGAGQGERHHKVGLTRGCRPASGNKPDAVFYIQKGMVRLTVISNEGKEATIGILGLGDFCGEGCLTGRPLRLGTAAAMTDSELMRVDKKAMMVALHQEPTLAAIFT
jgi:CRP-like cAMP-binding protein